MINPRADTQSAQKRLTIEPQLKTRPRQLPLQPRRRQRREEWWKLRQNGKLTPSEALEKQNNKPKTPGDPKTPPEVPATPPQVKDTPPPPVDAPLPSVKDEPSP